MSGQRAAYSCTALDCDRQPETVDGVNGRRCHAHPPAYSPHYLRALMAARRYATARAYIRTMVAWGQETGR